MEEVVVTEHKKRKPKTPDKDIKEFFKDYTDCKDKIKAINKHKLSRNLTQEEKDEINYLEGIIQANENILNQFDDRKKYILEQYYLRHRKLYSLVTEVFMTYEYISALKIEADISIRKWLSGNVINSTIGKALYKDVREYLKSATMK